MKGKDVLFGIRRIIPVAVIFIVFLLINAIITTGTISHEVFKECILLGCVSIPLSLIMAWLHHNGKK